MHPNRTDHRAAVAGLVGALLLSVLAVVPVAANTTAQTLPFTQDWTNTGLITTDNNWNGVPGVSGFLGANIAVTGADPQTGHRRRARRSTVVANQTDPAGLGTGGVAEFELANPVVAHQGLDDGRRPEHRDLRQHDRPDEHPRRLQPARYRRLRRTTPSSRSRSSTASPRPGSFTNLPAGYVADATTGPSLATLVTPVSVTLPAAANNQPVVQTARHHDRRARAPMSGSASTTSRSPACRPIRRRPSPAPRPSDGAIDVAVDANLQVTFSEPVDVAGSWFDVSCAGSGTHPATVSGGPTDLHPRSRARTSPGARTAP